MDDEYKGEDRKGRVTYDKYKQVKKTLKGPEYKNLLQQFMEMFKTPTTTVAPGRSKKTTPKKTAVKRTQKSKIPASPTR
jgi:hypothetical protein